MSDEKRHVLYIAEFSTGGSIESLHCLVRGLDKNLYRATVLFYFMPTDQIVAKFKAAGSEVLALYAHRNEATRNSDVRNRNMQGRVRKLLGVRMEKQYEAFKYALHFIRLRLPIYRAIKKAIFKIEPDLIHLNNGIRSDTPGILAARAYGAPTICHVRTFSKLTYLNVAAAKAVDQFVCISNAVKQTIVDYGIAENRCTVVANAVDTEIFRPSERLSLDVRQDFGFREDDFVFALIGRVVSWKGHDVFIDAVDKAREMNTKISGLIVGDAEPTGKNAEFMQKIRARVRELKLENAVQFAGHRSDVADIMRAANVVVCPSSEPEPFGRVIIESMSVGTPVIATRAGGATDIIEHDTNGLLVKIKDHSALAQAMIQMSNSPRELKQMSIAGRHDATERFNVSIHINMICNIYTAVL